MTTTAPVESTTATQRSSQEPGPVGAAADLEAVRAAVFTALAHVVGGMETVRGGPMPDRVWVGQGLRVVDRSIVRALRAEFISRAVQADDIRKQLLGEPVFRGAGAGVEGAALPVGDHARKPR